eukprot:5870250-Amphidinium_carterae.1
MLGKCQEPSGGSSASAAPGSAAAEGARMRKDLEDLHWMLHEMRCLLETLRVGAAWPCYRDVWDKRGGWQKG